MSPESIRRDLYGKKIAISTILFVGFVLIGGCLTAILRADDVDVEADVVVAGGEDPPALAEPADGALPVRARVGLSDREGLSRVWAPRLGKPAVPLRLRAAIAALR